MCDVIGASVAVGVLYCWQKCVRQVNVEELVLYGLCGVAISEATCCSEQGCDSLCVVTSRYS